MAVSDNHTGEGRGGQTETNIKFAQNTSYLSRRDILTASSVSVLAGLAGCLNETVSGGDDNDDSSFSFATAPEDSFAFAMANYWASVLEQNSDVEMDVQAGSGSQSVSLLAQGDVNLGYSSTFIGLDAMNRRPPFDDVEIQHELMQVLSYYFMRIGFVTNTSSDLKSYDQLTGEPIAPGPSGASFWDPVEHVLRDKLGFSDDDFDLRHGGPGRYSEQLSSDQVVATGGPLNMNGIVPSFMEQVYSENDVRLLEWPEEVVSEIEDDPRVEGITVSNDKLGDIAEFPSENESFMLTDGYCIWSSDHASEQAIYDLLSTTWNHRTELSEGHAGFGSWTEEDFLMSQFTTEIPLHPGTARFLDEVEISYDDYDVADI